MPTPKVLILNASPIIVLKQLEVIDMLLALATDNGFEIIVPRNVFNELRETTRGSIQESVERNSLILYDPRPEILINLKNYCHSLHDGEISVFAAYFQLKENRNNEIIAIIDEANARKIAERLGINLGGTLTLIKIMVKQRLLNKEQAAKLIDKLPETGFHISKFLINQAKKSIILDC